MGTAEQERENGRREQRCTLFNLADAQPYTHAHTHTHTHTHTHAHTHACSSAWPLPASNPLASLVLAPFFSRLAPFFCDRFSLSLLKGGSLSCSTHTHTHTHTRTHTHAHAHAHAHTHTGALVGHLELRFLFSLVSQRASTFLCPPSLFSLSPAAASLIPLLYFSHALVVLPTVTAGKTCVREREESNVCYRKRWNVGEAFSPSLSLSLSSYRSALTRSRL